MNEELQSTNEELETMNDELQVRTDDLNETNAFLESVLTSMRAGVTVLDSGLHVLAWNRGAEDLWGLRAAEAQGQNFLNLDIGLPVETLRELLRKVLRGVAPTAETTIEATNRRGRVIACRVICSPISAQDVITGAIISMEELDAPHT
jgi:two-component system CheB/CheR fusion protein